MGSKNRHGKKEESAAFDQAALNKLTGKIDQDLSRSSEPSAGKGKRKRHDAVTPGPKPKKRQLNEEGRNSEEKSSQSKKPRPGAITRDALLEEIRALGGDEDDLELIANVDSDADEESQVKPKPGAENQIDSKLKRELAKFASSLGFQNLSDGHDIEPEESAHEKDDRAACKDADSPKDTEEEPQEETTLVKESTGKSRKGKTIFEPHPNWNSLNMDGLPTTMPDQVGRYSAAIAQLKAHAQRLLDEDAATYSAGQKSSSSQRFLSTIMSSGTLSDKVSALTLAIQESPVHNIKAMESLINLSAKKSRGQAIAALGALVDLLGNGMLLPSDRRLRHFAAQPGLVGSLHQQSITSWSTGKKLPQRVTQAHLLVWAFEDWLKDAYFRIIQILEVWSGDEIEYSRMRALDFAYGLLKDKPEQEANLLRLIVNKLGDRERKIASRASYLLLQLLDLHPGMKAVVVRSLEHEVLLRPGQNMRTKYYAVNTLNQTIMSSKEPAIADNLVRIYFDVFMTLLKTGSLASLDVTESKVLADKEKEEKPRRRQRGKPPPRKVVAESTEADSAQKLVSAVLTGVNRAISFTTTDDPTLEKYLDTLYKITHSSNFNTSIQALMLIHQLASRKHLAVERFYRTLYESLLDPRLVTSSKQAMYLNTLYRALKDDVDMRRVKAFVKRMLQVAHLHQPSFACGILFMVAELEGIFPDLHALVSQPEDNEDDEEVYRDADKEQNEQQPATLAHETKHDAQRSRAYDGRKRDPEYSNADKSCLWELVPFLAHFHPSVKVFAANIFERQKALPKPELANHLLMHFLDKFVYRNPKATERKHGGSIMQPVTTVGTATQVIVPGKAGAAQATVINSASFWNLKPEQVAADDVFFHEYYAQSGKPALAVKAARKKAESKNEKVDTDEEEAEEEIWEALVNSKPDIEVGDDLDGSDLNMEDYDDSDDAMELDVAEMESELGSEASAESGGFEGIFGGSDEEDEHASGVETEWDDLDLDDADEEGEATKSEKSKRNKEKRDKRKEMRSLPIFASADDYAHMLAGEQDGLED